VNSATGSIEVVVGLGANLGDRQRQLRDAAAALGTIGIVRGVSALYESSALGPPQPDYLNAAVLLATHLAPLELLDALLRIETEMGRIRRQRWGPRHIDLDILWSDGLTYTEPRLTIPHPGLSERPFALLPLLDVAPIAIDPRSRTPYSKIARQLGPGAGSIRRLAGSDNGLWTVQTLL
jgi:2-amino-4-hydroxy-6-hydroxymethyldihydropteridine diphosphokinase